LFLWVGSGADQEFLLEGDRTIPFSGCISLKLFEVFCKGTLLFRTTCSISCFRTNRASLPFPFDMIPNFGRPSFFLASPTMVISYRSPDNDTTELLTSHVTPTPAGPFLSHMRGAHLSSSPGRRLDPARSAIDICADDF